MHVNQPESNSKVRWLLSTLYRTSMEQEFCVDDVRYLIGHAKGEVSNGNVTEENQGVFLICVSDKRLIFSGLLPGSDMDEASAFIDSVMKFNKTELEEFLRSQAKYNPYEDRAKRVVTAKKDLNIRRQYSKEHFQDGDVFTASDKRKLVHDLERFLVSRLFGGESHAKSRFKNTLYQLLINNYGYEGREDSTECYYDQFSRKEDVQRNMRLLAGKNTVYGVPLRINTDLLEAINKVAKAYKDSEPID